MPAKFKPSGHHATEGASIMEVVLILTSIVLTLTVVLAFAVGSK